MPEETNITCAEAARRLGVSCPMVRKYIAQGMPMSPKRKIPWPAAKDWHAKFISPTKSGNFRSRNAAKDHSASEPTTFGRVDMGRAFLAGAATVWQNLRAEMPAVLGDAAGLTEEIARDRVVVFAVANHLISRWFADINEASLKPIDWTAFKVWPGAEAEFERATEWLRSLSKAA